MKRVKRGTRIADCFQYGELRRIMGQEEETWVLDSLGFNYEFINCTFIETLDDLSMSGWDLVCSNDLGYILRRKTQKERPIACKDDQEEDEEINQAN